MTEDVLQALVDGLAPIVRAYVDQRLAEAAKETAGLRDRVAALEMRAPADPVVADRLTLTLDTDPDRVN